MSKTIEPSRDIARLIEIMAALRTPGTGCPWDLAQNFQTIAPYTLEEAYEVADAIERRDLDDLKEELGDLLLQVVYHARMAEEADAFSFGDVVEGVTAKMIRRHPHVFGDETARSPGAVDGIWAKIKAEEKALKQGAGNGKPAQPSVLSDIPAALPGLTRAIKLQDKAARVGFDWPGLIPVFDKVREELAELEEVALPHPSEAPAADAITEEFGDLLFVVANVARHLKIDPEAALRGANQKFIRRFSHIEQRLAGQGRAPAQSSLEEMDALWDEAKAIEKAKAASSGG